MYKILFHFFIFVLDFKSGGVTKKQDDTIYKWTEDHGWKSNDKNLRDLSTPIYIYIYI